MKTLVIPDIHLKWKKAGDVVLQFEHEVDEIVLTGDYFDDFKDTPVQNREMALWLIDFCKQDNHIALLGNHEFNYLNNKRLIYCSGYSEEKRKAINEVMKKKHWDKLRPIYESQGWYFTHAGINPYIALHPVTGWDGPSFIEKVEKELKELKTTGDPGTMFRVGMARGGRHRTGGITWCDFRYEFSPIPEIKQVFGHTPDSKPRQTLHGDNWCIDTHLNHVALIDDGTLRIIDL